MKRPEAENTLLARGIGWWDMSVAMMVTVIGLSHRVP
jgi:hypothetical protein